MTSTYVNDLRLNEQGTGDNPGSWGTVTNTNLELIAEAFSYGTETIGDADTTITMQDGTSDAARSLYLKIASSADLTTTRVITLAPNTVSKVWIIENATSGGQIITIKQGTGATVNIPNGSVKVIATDGAGSGGIVYDLFTDLDLTGTTTVATLTTSGNVGIGASSPSVLLDLESANPIIRLTDSDASGTPECQISGAGGDLILDADRDNEKSTSIISFKVDGTQRAVIGASEAVFNEDDNNYDFRVESETNAHAIFVDADNAGVGIFNSADTDIANLAIGLTGAVISGDTDGATIGKGGIVQLCNGNNFGSSDATVFLLGGGTSGAVGQIASGFGFARHNLNNWGTQIKMYVHPADIVDLDELHEAARVGPLEFVVNETSNNYDFRIESDDQSYMFFLDGDNNRIGIKNTSPGTDLSVRGDSANGIELGIDNDDSASSSRLFFTSGSGANSIRGHQGSLLFSTGSTAGTASGDERFRLGSNGEIQIGGTTNAGFVDFDGSNLQFNTQRNPNTGTFVNTGRAHTSITMFDGNGTAANSYIRFMTTNANNTVATERLKIDSTGDVTISDGDLVIGTSGHGIDFSATSDGSGTSTSELLDDYEEGVFTPALTINDSTSGITYLSRSAGYVKIGKQVFVNGDIQLSNKGSSSGVVKITSLPFTINDRTAGTTLDGGASLCAFSNGTSGIHTAIGLMGKGGSTEISMYVATSNDGQMNDQLSASNITDGFSVRFSLTYIV